MYQIILTIYRTDEILIHYAENGNIPMVFLCVERGFDLKSFAQCGRLCLKVSKVLGDKLEVKNQKIVLIEDLKLADNQTELYFIGELYRLNEQDFIEFSKLEDVKRILIELQRSIKNIRYRNFQLKVQKNSIPTNQLVQLILKIFFKIIIQNIKIYEL
ncbi:unnamed protein product [Paramecium sonneborni]|uniref:Uncharacterized protein n=1 Tax=Paramecium sonneborni TaxID=65129 RepID=A0A8S1N453_9CILI|nr:unnamed protein product [Paramecium sonneborni]